MPPKGENSGCRHDQRGDRTFLLDTDSIILNDIQTDLLLEPSLNVQQWFVVPLWGPQQGLDMASLVVPPLLACTTVVCLPQGYLVSLPKKTEVSK